MSAPKPVGAFAVLRPADRGWIAEVVDLGVDVPVGRLELHTKPPPFAEVAEWFERAGWQFVGDWQRHPGGAQVWAAPMERT